MHEAQTTNFFNLRQKQKENQISYNYSGESELITGPVRNYCWHSAGEVSSPAFLAYNVKGGRSPSHPPRSIHPSFTQLVSKITMFAPSMWADFCDALCTAWVLQPKAMISYIRSGNHLWQHLVLSGCLIFILAGLRVNAIDLDVDDPGKSLPLFIRGRTSRKTIEDANRPQQTI